MPLFLCAARPSLVVGDLLPELPKLRAANGRIGLRIERYRRGTKLAQMPGRGGTLGAVFAGQ
jgi:hypothetical protein